MSFFLNPTGQNKFIGLKKSFVFITATPKFWRCRNQFYRIELLFLRIRAPGNPHEEQVFFWRQSYQNNYANAKIVIDVEEEPEKLHKQVLFHNVKINLWTLNYFSLKLVLKQQ
jgi:hypothetical protein